MNHRNEAVGFFLGFTLIITVNLVLMLPVGFGIVYLLEELIKLGILRRNPQDMQGYGIVFSAINSICIYQYLYVVPFALWLKSRQYWGFMKGIIAAAVVTTLLLGMCFVAFVPSALG